MTWRVANAAPLLRPSGSTASRSAVAAARQPTIGYDEIAAARSHACSRLENTPTSRIRLGEVRALTHLMLAMEAGK